MQVILNVYDFFRTDSLGTLKAVRIPAVRRTDKPAEIKSRKFQKNKEIAVFVASLPLPRLIATPLLRRRYIYSETTRGTTEMELLGEPSTNSRA